MYPSNCRIENENFLEAVEQLPFRGGQDRLILFQQTIVDPTEEIQSVCLSLRLRAILVRVSTPFRAKRPLSAPTKKATIWKSAPRALG